MNRPRAADDFETIRARIDELRRERAAGPSDQATSQTHGDDSDAERRRRAVEGARVRLERA